MPSWFLLLGFYLFFGFGIKAFEISREVCDFEPRDVTYAASELRYPLLTIPQLKSIVYPEQNNHFVWLSLSRSTVFEFQNISVAIVQRFCGITRARHITLTGQMNQTPDMAVVGTVKLQLLTPLSQLNFEQEEYLLNIDTTTISLSAYCERGLLHGLSTLGQLLESPSPIAMPVYIHDWPEVPWRGLMVDVVRHFIPMELLFHTLDAMEAAKFNILHLHLTDSQHFPVLFRDREGLQLSSLALKGASISSYAETKTDKRNVYNLGDLGSLVQYAAARGIEVVPEIDVPSHARSWGHAYPELIVKCPVFAARQEHPVNVYTLNPTRLLTLRIVQEMISQISEVFPSKYLHIGGDEVLTQCWSEDPSMVQWVKEKNTTFEELLSDFESAVFDMVRAEGKIPIGWQDLVDGNAYPAAVPQSRIRKSDRMEEQKVDEKLTSGLDSTHGETDSISPPSLVHAWKCWGGLAGKAAGAAASRGHDIITSACWYLDFDSDLDAFLEAQPVTAAKRAASEVAAKKWRKRYRTELSGNRVGAMLETDAGGRVLGGEAAVWTEGIDFTNFECRVWPRAASVSMSLWGYKNRSLVVMADPSYAVTPAENGQNIVSSYVRFSHYLRRFNIRPSDITLHSYSNSVMSSPFNFQPHILRKESAIHKFLQKHRFELTGHGDFKFDDVKVISQCPALDEDMVRPVNPERGGHTHVKIVQLNIAEGGTGSRRELLHEWFREQALHGVSLIGLCELNMWHVLESTTEARSNFPVMRSRAAKAGFAFSHVLHSEVHPYNVGVMSAVPFEVMGEYGPPQFQRGVLHIYLETLNVHAFITHLHAHNSSQREIETADIVQIVKPYLHSGKHKVIVMGDLNSLFLKDQRFHVEDNMLTLLQQTNHSVYKRLKGKFCDISGDHINYQPLENLVEVGLKESCTTHCAIASDLVAYDSCAQTKCSRTQPTAYNPEWPTHIPMPKMRLDYIFVDQNVLLESNFDAGVEISDVTMRMSDHLPVYVSWTDRK